jgi:hypothetical protein
MQFSHLLRILLSLTAVLPVSAANLMVPPDFKVNSAVYAGTGCSGSTVDVRVASNGTMLRLEFDQFAVQYGPNISVTEWRKTCGLHIDLLVPPGYQFEVLNTDFSSYADIGDGVIGSIQSTYYFNSSTLTVREHLRKRKIPGANICLANKLGNYQRPLHWGIQQVICPGHRGGYFALRQRDLI